MVVRPLIIQTKLCFFFNSNLLIDCLADRKFVVAFLTHSFHIESTWIDEKIAQIHTQNAHKPIYSDGFSLREFFTGFTISLSRFITAIRLAIFIGKAKSINCLLEFSSQKIYDRLLIMSELSLRCMRFFLCSSLNAQTLVFANWSINVFELSLSAHLNIPHSESRIELCN